MKKKVGKGFTKILSVILAAAMVVSSAPETSLVVRAEGSDVVSDVSVDVTGNTGTAGDEGEAGAGDNADADVDANADNNVDAEKNLVQDGVSALSLDDDELVNDGLKASVGLASKTITAGDGQSLTVTAPVSYEDFYDGNTKKGKITVSGVNLTNGNINATDHYTVEISKINYIDNNGTTQSIISGFSGLTYTDVALAGLKNQTIEVTLKASLKPGKRCITEETLFNAGSNVVSDNIQYYIGTSAPTTLADFKKVKDLTKEYIDITGNTKIYVYLPSDAFASGFELEDIKAGSTPTSIKTPTTTIDDEIVYNTALTAAIDDNVEVTAKAVTPAIKRTLTLSKHTENDPNIKKIQYTLDDGETYADYSAAVTVDDGTTVGIRVYLAKDATITASDGNNVALTLSSDGTYYYNDSYAVSGNNKAITFTSEINKYYVCAAAGVKNGAAEAIAPTAYQVNNDSYTAGSEAVNTTIKAGQTVTFTVTDADNTDSTVIAYKVGDTNTTVSLTKGAEGKYTFEMPKFNVEVKVTTNTKSKVTFDPEVTAIAAGSAQAVKQGAVVKSIKWGTTEATAATNTLTLNTTGSTITSDKEDDFYFTVEPNAGYAIDSVKIGSATADKVSDTVFKIVQSDTELKTDSAIVVTASKVSTTDIMTVSKDSNVDVYYQFVASGGSAPSSKSDMTKLSGTLISKPASAGASDKLYVYAEVPNSTKYMLSSMKVNGVNASLAGASDATNTTSPAVIEADKFATGFFAVDKPATGTWSFEVKTEALAHDYTIDWSDAVFGKYIVRVDEDTVVKQIAGNGTFEVGGQVQPNDQVDLIVRVLDGKELKFRVESTDEAREVDDVSCGSKDVTEWSDYYSIKSAADSNPVNRTITVTTAPITAKTVGIKIDDQATGINKITTNVNTDGKRTNNAAEQFKVENPTAGSSINLKVFPGVVATVNIEMNSNNFYSVDTISYKNKDGKNVVIKDATSFTVDLDEIDFDGRDDIVIKTKKNEAVTNKAVFTYDYNNVTVTPSTESFTATKKTASMLPDATTASATGNSLTFSYTENNGYTVKKITIGDKTYEGTELAALGKSGIVVDFGKTEKTDANGTKTYESNSGQVIDVIIETEAPANTADRRFAVTNNGESKISYQVTTPGVTSYTKKSGNVTTTYYDIDKDAEINEVELVATAPKGYILSATDTIADVNGFQTVSNEENTVTYKIVTSKLAAVSADTEPEKVTIGIRPNNYIFNLEGSVKPVEGSLVPTDGDSYDFDKSWEVQIESYEKLYVRKANDASGNAQWEVVPTDEEYVAVISMANIVDTDDDGTIDGVYYKVVNEAYEALDYKVEATVDGNAVETPSDGLLKSVTVTGGETVTLTITDKTSGNDIAVKQPTALDDKVYKSVIGPLTNNTSVNNATIAITTSAKDAGLTIPVSIVNVVTVNGKQSEVPVVDFEIVVAGRATEASVEGVVDGKLDLTVGQKTTLGLTLDKSIPEEVIDLISITATGKLNGNINYYVDKDGKTDYSKLVFDTTTLKADETSTVTVKCDSKTLTSFVVTGKAPQMGIKSVSSPSQGYNYINVTVVPETITRSRVNTEPLYYEFKVSPATGNTVSSATSYIYKEVAGDVNTDAKTFTTKSSTYKLDVNTAKLEDKKIGAYDVEVRMVVGNPSLLESTATSVSSNILAGSAADTSLKAVSTKLAYVEDSLKLAKKSATVTANQKTLVNTLKYSDNASYVASPTFRVLNADGTVAWNTSYGGNEIDGAGNVYVKAPAGTKPGTYTVEVSSETALNETGNDMVASVATFKLKVKDGMTSITVPSISTIYLRNGKSATASFKATGYGTTDSNGKLRKTADQNFIYSVTTANKANEGKVKISSSGKVTVAKDFVVSSSTKLNTFTVTVKAKNFDLRPETRTVEVTKEKMEIASIELVDANGKNLGTSVDYNTITNEVVYVCIKDSKGNKLGFDDVTITPSSGNVYVTSYNGTPKLYVKPGKAPKSITIKATAKDGGKSKKSVKFTLGYKTDGNLDLDLDGTGFVSKTEPTNNNFVIVGNGEPVSFTVYDGTSHENEARRDIYNYSVKIKGGTLLKDDDAYDAEFTFRPTAKDVTITITDKAKKPKVVSTYTINISNFSAEKAPKFSLVKGMKLYAGVNASQKLTYNVTTDCTAVQINQVSYSNTVFANLVNNTVAVKDGKFDLNFNYTDAKTGTIKYEAIFGKYDDNGNFVPVTKAKEFSVKLTKAANVVPQTEYTVYYDSTASFEFKASPDYAVTVTDVLNDNVAGKYNNFAKYFVQSAANPNVIELQSAVIAAIKDAKITTDINELVPEADRTGYIKYQYRTSSGSVVKTAKVTVTFAKDGKVDGYVKADPTLSSSIVYAYGELVDKNGKAIDIDSVYSTGDWAVTKYTTGGSNALQFRSTKAVVGENTVTFKVLTDKSYYSKYGSATAEKYGTEVTAVITVLDSETATGKLDVKKNGAVVDLNGKTATQSWTTKTSTTGVGTYTNYVALEDVFANVRGTDKKVTDISNLKITKAETVETEGVSAQLTQVNGEYVVEISVDQDKLTAGGTTDVDVKFSFDNSKAAETVKFSVVAPKKFYTIADVAAELKTALEASNYGDDVTSSNVSTYVGAILDKYKASGITLVSASVQTPTAPDTIYTVKAKIKSILDTTGDTAVEIEAALKATGSKKALADVDAAYDAVFDIINKQIKNESFKDDVAYTAEGVDQSNYLIVTAGTTREDIRAFVQKEINEYTNGSDYTVTVPVNGFSKKAAQNYESGEVTVKVYITKGVESSDTLTKTYKTLHLKYVAPTTTTP